jgi:predicted nucleic-acid-binding protein
MDTTWVLSSVYGISAAGLAVAIDMLLNHRTLTIQDADVVASALQKFQSRPALGFSNCLMLEVARKAGHLPLGTFDRSLSKLAGTERI